MVGVDAGGKEGQNGGIWAAEEVEAVVEERGAREVRREGKGGFGEEGG